MKNFPFFLSLFLSSLLKAQCPWTMTVTSQNNSFNFTCNVTTLTFTAVHNCTNNVTYSWSGPGVVGGANSPTVLVNQTGQYLLVITDVVTSCSDILFFNVNSAVSPPVALTNPSNGLTVTCASPSQMFTTTVMSSSTHITYKWFAPNNPNFPAFTSAGSQCFYSPQVTGSHTLEVKDTLSGCVTMHMRNVLVNSTAPTYSMQSNNGYLIGCDPVTTVSITNLVLSAPGATGSFTFIPPGGAYTFPFNFTSSNTPSVVTLSAIGSYSLIVQDDSNGCQAQTLIYIAQATTSLSLTYTLNSGGIVDFESTSTGTNSSTTYQWVYGDGTSGSGVNTSHTYLNGGTHNVVLQTTNPSCTSVPVPVNVNTIPCNAISSFSLFPSGTPQLWHASPDYFGNVTNAVWNWGDGSFTNALYPSHTYSAAGLYNICLSVTVSCANTSSTCSNYNIYRSLEVQTSMVTVNVIPNSSIATGLNQTGTPISLKIFPNPANDFLIIDTERNDVVISNIFIIDMTGRSVFSEPVFDKRLQLINTSNLQTGVYIIELHTEDQILRKKISISK